jgi:hypothetical protein
LCILSVREHFPGFLFNLSEEDSRLIIRMCLSGQIPTYVDIYLLLIVEPKMHVPRDSLLGYSLLAIEEDAGKLHQDIYVLRIARQSSGPQLETILSALAAATQECNSSKFVDFIRSAPLIRARIASAFLTISSEA